MIFWTNYYILIHLRLVHLYAQYISDRHASLKEKHVRCNQAAFVSKELKEGYHDKVNPYCPNFEFFHKNLRFGVFLSVDNYFTFKNSKKYVLMAPGPKY